MKTNGVFFTLSLTFVLFLSGCGAYEQAQEAARLDQQKQKDSLNQKTEQLKSLTHVCGWYLQFHQQNAKSPAELEELLGSVVNPTQERTAAAIEMTRRLAGNGEIMIDWNIDLAAWQASGQDLSKYRIAWTTKTEVYNVYVDGAGKVHDVLTAAFTTVKRMTGVPASQVATTNGTDNSQSGVNNSSTAPQGNSNPPPITQGKTPAPTGAPARLSLNSTPAEFVTALKSGENVRIMQALGFLTGSPTAQPNNEISSAILAAMNTGDQSVLLTGVMALEKWGTAASAPELEALAAKSGNFGLQAQARRIVPILRGRR